MSRVLVCALLLFCASEHSAQAATESGDGDSLRHWLERIEGEVEHLITSHRRVPPTPVKLRWHARRIWTGVVAGDVLDLATADLGADGQDELLLLTSRSLMVLSRRRGLFDVRTEVELAGQPASQRSRDAIGMLAIGPEPGLVPGVLVRTRSSETATGSSFVWRDGTLRRDSELIGYPFCDSATLDAAPGQNYFLGESVTWPSDMAAILASALYSVRCTKGMVDSLGNPVRYLSQVSLMGELTLQCEGEGCLHDPLPYLDAGYAHLVVDLSNDGRPEVVTTSGEARGGSDRIQVFSYDGSKRKLVFERSFVRGIVALGAGDFDGDGTQELVAAERGVAGRVSLWLLN